MNILAIVIVIVAYFLESAFWMGALCGFLGIILVRVFETRDDDSLKKWQRNMLYALLIAGMCLTGSIASNNAKKNRIAEIKEVYYTIK